MINGVKEDITAIRKDINQIYVKMDSTHNHLSKRLPAWATIIITILGSLVTGLIVANI